MPKEESLLVPIAEHFHSIQGEGEHTGIPMHFIRLAGCSVGTKATRDFRVANNLEGTLLPVLQNGATASMCHTYDGRYFECDTDFHLSEKIPLDSLLLETYEDWLSLTGGEPLNHKDKPWFGELFRLADIRDLNIHIETSGTVEFDCARRHWITVAPKKNFLPSMVEKANEVRLLVDDSFDIQNVPEVILDHPHVQISPINDEKTINFHNVDLCHELLGLHPSWRLSMQMHKVLGVR